MSNKSPGTGRLPKNLWIDAHTFVFEQHDEILEGAVMSCDALKVIFIPYPVLGIQNLTPTDLVLLKMAHPGLELREHIPGDILIDDAASFAAVEATLELLGEHIGTGRLVGAYISLIDSDMFRELESRFAGRPDVFVYGLRRAG